MSARTIPAYPAIAGPWLIWWRRAWPYLFIGAFNTLAWIAIWQLF